MRVFLVAGALASAALIYLAKRIVDRGAHADQRHVFDGEGLE